MGFNHSAYLLIYTFTPYFSIIIFVTIQACDQFKDIARFDELFGELI